MTMHSNIPHHESGITTAFKGASARIDEIYDELLHNEETDIQGKVELYAKLLRECISSITKEEEEEFYWALECLWEEANKLLENKPNTFFSNMKEFDSVIRRKIHELKTTGKIV